MRASLRLGLHQLIAQRIGQSRHHLILQLEEIGDAFLEPIGPEMRAGLAINKLRVDAHLVLVALHRAFENIAHAQFFADLLGVDVLALEGEGGVARDHEAVADARQIGGEVLGDAISKIILAWIAREVPERQHHDREMSSAFAAASFMPRTIPGSVGGLAISTSNPRR